MVLHLICIDQREISNEGRNNKTVFPKSTDKDSITLVSS